MSHRTHLWLGAIFLMVIVVSILATTVRADARVADVQEALDIAERKLACAAREVDCAGEALKAAQARQARLRRNLQRAVCAIDDLRRTICSLEGQFAQLRSVLGQVDSDLAQRQTALADAERAACESEERFVDAIGVAIDRLIKEPWSLEWWWMILDAQAAVADETARVPLATIRSDVWAAEQARSSAEAEWRRVGCDLDRAREELGRLQCNADALRRGMDRACREVCDAQARLDGALAALACARRERDVACARLREALALCQADHERLPRGWVTVRIADENRPRTGAAPPQDSCDDDRGRERERPAERGKHDDSKDQKRDHKKPTVKPDDPPKRVTPNDVQHRREAELRKAREAEADRHRAEQERQTQKDRDEEAARRERQRLLDEARANEHSKTRDDSSRKGESKSKERGSEDGRRKK